MGNAPVTMGLKTHKNSYQHGETMTGTVYLSVTSVDAKIQSYQGIQLSFGGQENTEVRIKEENGDRGTTYRTERETASIFHVEIPLTTFSSPLRPANYEFPFEWKLPDTPLPSSFRNRKSHSGHCEVRYTLSAYLMPQDGSRNPMGFLSSNIHSTSSSGTSASQTIQFVGAPTRAIPEPLQLAEERTVVNGLCCCWKQGHISLGWEADTIVLTPQAECKLLLRGSNASAIPVSKLRVQLIQSVHWQAGSDDDFQKRHTRSHNTTLVDYYVDVGHLQQWHGTAEKPQGGYQSVYEDDNDDDGDDDHDDHYPLPTSFQVPPDIMDTYQGHNCRIEHTLIVSAVTRMFATNPKVPYNIHVQRIGIGSSPAAVPVATAWMDETEYQDAVLPSNWSPDEKVPVIHLTEITSLDDDAITNAGIATAEAVMVMQPDAAAEVATSDDPLAFARPAGMTPSAPLEDEMTSYGSDLQEVLGLLEEVDFNDMTTHRRIEHQIRRLPVCQTVMAHMTPQHYQFLCQAATKDTLHRISLLLATELNSGPQGFRGEYLVALMQLPMAKEGSLSLIGSLADQICDLDQSASFVEQSLRPDDASWFRERVEAIRMRKQKAAH